MTDIAPIADSGPPPMRPPLSGRHVAAFLVTLVLSAGVGAVAYKLVGHFKPGVLAGRLSPELAGGGGAVLSTTIGMALLHRQRWREDYGVEVWADGALQAKLFPMNEENRLKAGSLFLGPAFGQRVLAGQPPVEISCAELPKIYSGTVSKEYLQDSHRSVPLTLVQEMRAPPLTPLEQTWTAGDKEAEKNRQATLVHVKAFKGLIDDKSKIETLLRFHNQCLQGSSPTAALGVPYLCKGISPLYSDDPRCQTANESGAGSTTQEHFMNTGEAYIVRRNRAGDHFEIEYQQRALFEVLSSGEVFCHMITLTYDLGRGTGSVSWSGPLDKGSALILKGLE